MCAEPEDKASGEAEEQASGAGVLGGEANGGELKEQSGNEFWRQTRGCGGPVWVQLGRIGMTLVIVLEDRYRQGSEWYSQDGRPNGRSSIEGGHRGDPRSESDEPWQENADGP